MASRDDANETQSSDSKRGTEPMKGAQVEDPVGPSTDPMRTTASEPPVADSASESERNVRGDSDVGETPELHDKDDGSQGIEGEDGLYPIPDTSVASLFSANAQIFRVHPKKGNGELLTEGKLWIAKAQSVGSRSETDQAEAADDVTFVAQCGDIRFYVKSTDPSVKISSDEYVILMPEECLGVVLVDAKRETSKAFEDILKEHTIFRVEEDPNSFLKPEDFDEDDRKEMFPEDPISQRIMSISGWLCNQIVSTSCKISGGVHSYGEKKTMGVSQSEGAVGENKIKAAAAVRRTAEAANHVIVGINDKLSNLVGKKVVPHLEVREGDSNWKARARQAAASAMLSYAQVSESMWEGYNLVILSAKEESQTYFSKRYGTGADKLVGHSTATAVSVTSSVLSARRIVSVRKIMKKNATRFARQHAQSAVGLGKK